jgi:membrane protein implicated in regulation of membrane protease activity
MSRRPDLGAVAAGVVLAGVGICALALGASAFSTSLKWVWPGVLIGIGVLLLVVRPGGPARSAGQHRPRHEVRPERGEDGEVQQPRRRHHG